MERKSLLNKVCALIIFIFILNLLANKFYWYVSISYFDMIMHALGGFWLALAIIFVFKIENFNKKNLLKILFWVLIVGGLWELFEFGVREIVWKNPLDTPIDTLSDLVCDLFGGFMATIYYFRKNIFK